jgi:hypothetical protein
MEVQMARQATLIVRGLLATMATAGVLAAASAAQAQFRGPGGGGMAGMRAIAEPDISTRDFAVLDEELSLTDEQGMLIETLFEDYQTSFDAAREKLMAMAEQFRPRMPEGVDREQMRQQARERFGEFREKMRAIEEMGDEMTPEEREAAMEEVRAEMRAAREEMRGMMPQFPSGAELRKLTTDGEAALNTFQAEKQKLWDQFTSDVKLLLDERQTSKWPDVEQRLVRDRLLPAGELSGERVDLVNLVRDLNLPTELKVAIQPVMAEYSMKLNDVLKQRQNQMIDTLPDMVQAMFEMNVDKSADLMEQQMRMRIAVRNVNDQYVEVIAQRLPIEPQMKLREAYKLAAFERVYEKTRTQQAFAGAAELEGLATEVRQAIITLEQAYVTELNAQNAALEQTIRKNEPEQRLGWMRRMGERMAAMASGDMPEGGWRGRGGPGGNNDDDDDPIDEGFDKRRELSQKYLAQLEGMLTPEQYQGLPGIRGDGRDQRQGNWRGFQFREDGDGPPRGRDRDGDRGEQPPT